MLRRQLSKILFILLMYSPLNGLSQVIKLSTDTITIVYDTTDVILGITQFNISISEVLYNKSTKEFTIKGYVKELANNHDSLVYAWLYLIGRGNDTLISKTTIHGLFSAKLLSTEKLYVAGAYISIRTRSAKRMKTPARRSVLKK